MGWFQEHSFVATWLSPLIAVSIAIIKSRGKLQDIDIALLALVAAPLIALSAIVFTPGLDAQTKGGLFAIILFCLGGLITRR